MRKAYSGIAAKVTLDGGIFLDSTGFVANSGQGFPTGTDPFVVLIGRGTLNEEKLLVTRSGNAFTIVQRAYDGTLAKTHNAGEFIEHVLDAETLNEFNAFVNGQIPVGSDAAPSIGFVGGGGFYQAVANEIQVSLSGTLRTAWVGDQIRQTSTGGVGLPGFSFIGDPDTGLQRGSVADTLWLVTGGASRIGIDNTYVYMNVPQTRIQDGTVAAPGLSFWNDNDSGIYRVGDGNIAISTNGNRIISFAWGAATVHPGTDNTIALGLNTFRWKEVWAGTGTIQTSDATQKFDVSEPLGLDFISRLEPVTAKLKGGKRPHAMLMAQQVKQVMNDLGIDFAGYIDPGVTDGEGPLALRYSEFIPPLIKAVQQLKQRVEELEAGLK